MCLTYHKSKIGYNGKKYQSKSKDCDYKDQGQLMQKHKKKVKQIHISFENREKLSIKNRGPQYYFELIPQPYRCVICRHL